MKPDRDCDQLSETRPTPIIAFEPNCEPNMEREL